MASNNTRIAAHLNSNHPPRSNMANAQDERLLSSHDQHRQYGATESRVVSFDGHGDNRSESSSSCSSSTVDDVELANGEFSPRPIRLMLISLPYCAVSYRYMLYLYLLVPLTVALSFYCLVLLGKYAW
jgi:hypothetical protein